MNCEGQDEEHAAGAKEPSLGPGAVCALPPEDHEDKAVERDGKRDDGSRPGHTEPDQSDQADAEKDAARRAAAFGEKNCCDNAIPEASRLMAPKMLACVFESRAR